MIESNPAIKQKVDERRSQVTPDETQFLSKLRDEREVSRQNAEANRTEDLQQHGRRLNLRFNVNLRGQRNNQAWFGILICAGVTAFILVSEQRIPIALHTTHHWLALHFIDYAITFPVAWYNGQCMLRVYISGHYGTRKLHSEV